jgi:putative PEP-CTERM system integral membrane protein
MTTSRWFRFAVHFLFWSWNLLLLSCVVFGFVPVVVVPLVIDAVDGLARWDFVSTALVVTIVPIFSVWHAWQHRAHHRERPLDLLTFFVGVELAMLAVTMGRFFGLHELTGAGEVIFGAIVIGGFVAEVRVVLGDRLPPHQLFDGVTNVALVLRALAGLYVGALLSSITLPLLAQAVWSLGDLSAAGWAKVLFLLPLWLWLAASAVLLLLLPVAAPLSWFSVARRSSALVRQRWGVDDLLVTTLSPVAAGLVAVGVQWTQPHEGVLQRLQNGATDDSTRQALVADREAIERGLLDAYLGRHTYLGDDNSRPWSAALRTVDDGPRDHLLDGFFDAAIIDNGRPFFYAGRFGDDAEQARALYRAFFGRELERDHAASVRKALSARWSRDERFAGFVDEGQARVRLQRQDLSIRNDRAGVVAVEVHDTWVNQTGTDQEVVLAFELPESAAVTGLWLGPTDNRAEAFRYTVSPRGAAQQVYREEVRARRDPALLEQTGPRQYRLRVFPLPARQTRSGRDILDNGWQANDAPRVHVWLTYEALPDDDGGVPLPVLRERRNGFWDARTVRHVHFGSDVLGLSSAVDAFADAVDAVDGGGWVQRIGVALPAVARATVAARIDDGCAALVPAAAPDVPSLAGRTVDVVVDRSLAVADHTSALVDALAALRATGATLHFVLGTSALRAEPPLVIDAYENDDVARTVFFGAAQPKELLAQWIATRAAAAPDVVVVLAGGASFDVADDVPLPLDRLRDRALPRTLLVHLDGAMPRGYDDATLDGIRRSGGTATTSLRDGLLRLQDTPWVDGHRFDVRVDGAAGNACPSSGPGRAVVARQRILLADRGGKAPLASLDGLHRLAVDASVATPYSSLLVLVNARQRARLAQLEGQRDRFDREVDDDGKGARLAQLKQTVRQAARSAAPPPSSMKHFRGEAKAAFAPQATALPIAAPPSVANEATAARLSKIEASDNVGATREVAAAKDGAPPEAPPRDDEAAVDDDAAVAPQADSARDEAPTEETSPPPSVSGVPEPEEWLLVVLAIGIVTVFELHRRRRMV